MGVDVGHVNADSQRSVDLRPQFRLGLFGTNVRPGRFDGGMKIAFAVNQRGARRQRPPAQMRPFAVERAMQANVTGTPAICLAQAQGIMTEPVGSPRSK